MPVMREHLDAYFLHCSETLGRPAGSINTYRSALNLLFDWLGKEVGREPTLADLTLALLKRYDAHCRTKKTQRGNIGLGQRTRANSATVVRSFCQFLVEQGVLPDNPAEKLKVKITEKPKQICATEKEVKALFAACAYIRRSYRSALAGAVLATMAYAGLRRAEVCDLHLSDIRLHEEMPIIIVRKGKGGKRRELPLHRDACRYLACWLQHRPETTEPYLFMVPVCSHQNGYHVTRLTGGRIEGIIKELSELSKSAVLRHLTPHTFRRFMATKLLEVPGSNLRYVADALGQESILTTVRYIGTFSGKLHDLVQAMDFNGNSSPAATPAMPTPSLPKPKEDNRAHPPADRRKKPGWRRE